MVMDSSKAAGPVEVVTVGHAVVDVLASVTDEALTKYGYEKGSMTLVDADTSARLYGSVHPTATSSGGSAANTAVGVACLGARTAFVGRVRDDELGKAFTEDIRNVGVDYSVPPVTSGAATARCVVMLTPDAQRTMCTNLGAAAEMAPSDIDPALIGAAKVVYLEGYIVGPEDKRPVVDAIIDLVKKNKKQLAFSLSDPFWVNLHTDELRRVISHSDLVFGNEEEAVALTGESDAVAAAKRLAGQVGTVVVTRGSAGAVAVSGDTVASVPAEPLGKVVDTTGAGDLFAAGFLYGHVRGQSLESCARLGSLAAGEVIAHVGARPSADLASLAKARGLL